MKKMFLLIPLLLMCSKNPATPRMFGTDETDSGIATASSIYDDSIPQYAIDNNENTLWASANLDFPHWITFSFTDNKKIEFIRILSSISPWDNKSYLKKFSVYAGDDTTKLKKIFTSSGDNFNKRQWQEFEFNNNSSFLFYRIYFYGSWSVINKIVYISEIEMMQIISG